MADLSEDGLRSFSSFGKHYCIVKVGVFSISSAILLSIQ
jgi:hypothetical protein